MYVMPARWGFEGSVAFERAAIRNDPAWLIDLSNPSLNSPTDFIKGGKFECAIAQMASEKMSGGWGFTNYDLNWLPPSVLFGMTFGIFLLLLLLLKGRDPV
jgi:ABC transport system ATP-binding/permease protein